MSSVPFLDTSAGTKSRSAASSFAAAAEGLLSLAAFWGVLGTTVPVIPASERASPFHEATRSGACLSLGTPFLVLLVRCVLLAVERIKAIRQQQQQQQQQLPLSLSLWLPLPAGLDEHAVLDLYGIGLSAGMLGLGVPFLELTGFFLGVVLLRMSWVGRVVAFLATAVVVHLVFGEGRGTCVSGEWFFLHGRRMKGMLALCAAGHVVFLSSCFYSPDVARRVGFVLGFVHIVRLLRQAFSYPGVRDDGGPTSVEL